MHVGRGDTRSRFHFDQRLIFATGKFSSEGINVQHCRYEKTKKFEIRKIFKAFDKTIIIARDFFNTFFFLLRAYIGLGCHIRSFRKCEFLDLLYPSLNGTFSLWKCKINLCFQARCLEQSETFFEYIYIYIYGLHIFSLLLVNYLFNAIFFRKLNLDISCK